MTFDKNKPYNDLPELPPACELESKIVLKQAISARASLAALKSAGDLIPNQAVLIQAIGLQEAKLSSEIENIVTTNDELYRAFSNDDKTDDHQTKEVLSYKNALWFGYQESKIKNRPLTTRLFEEIVEIIKGTNLGVRKVPGTKLANPTTGEVVYTPPEGESVLRDKLSNLEKFIHAQDDLDPLVKLAVMHYQFEAIHPFTDGNGRTGRIINILYLIEQGLLEIPILYLSRFIIENKSAYYAGLRQITETQNWESWILYMLKGVAETAQLTCERIYAVRDLMKQTTELVQKKLPKIYSKDLVEALFQHPYTKIHFLQEAGLGTRQTAKKYLDELTGINLLKPIKVGREYYFINEGFLKILSR